MGEPRCRYCQKSFQPSKFQPRQTVCSQADCQRQRRTQYHKEKIASDPEYRQVCQDSSRKWRASHAGYWKQYREQHPTSTQQNREQQKGRDRKQRLCQLANLWSFTQFAYLDNPLPPLFKERLFVYLSRFCDVRYCVARHLGFLVGLGWPAGDADCLPQTVEAVLPLLRRPLARGEVLEPLLKVCGEQDSPIREFPPPDSEIELALFACATHVFLQTHDAVKAHAALRRALGPAELEYLNLLLSFIRTAH
jgi:hypothetical protein